MVARVRHEAGAPRAPLNALSVDVEEYYQVSAFDNVVSRDDWDRIPQRLDRQMAVLLDLLDEAEAKATFFVLGWVAERRRNLVREIHRRGHEIASHGYSHRLVYEQTPSVFREETRRAKETLEAITGGPVLGYRAASFSICKGSLWALDILASLGFVYDSSIFPIRHDRYGIPGAPRILHRLKLGEGRELIEIPPSTVKLVGMTLPVGGGGYLRMLPLFWTRWGIRRIAREGLPAVLYLHPWELDPHQPRIRAPLLSRLRHYTGLRGATGKLQSLLKSFTFTRMDALLAEEGRLEEPSVGSMETYA